VWVTGISRPAEPAFSGPVTEVSRHKTELRAKQRELRALLNEWDPLGVADIAPSEEYDCLLGVIGELRRGMSEPQLAGHLDVQLRHHFGVEPNQRNVRAFARRVFEWYWADPLPGSPSPRS
jgi:hypothetical protein